MRARFAILLTRQTVMLRAIEMQSKPAEMLVQSPKGTVPVLVYESDSKKYVIDKSLEIMLWALNQVY
jgi:glutathione S-transferase